MPTLPSAASFTGSTVTEAQFKSAITDLRDFLATLLGTAGTQAAALSALATALNGVVAKSASYTAAAGDRGKLINYSGMTAARTLTLPAAATAGAGFVLGLRNSDTTYSLTIDRNSATIDGAAANITLAPGESCLIVCDGTGWYTVGRTVQMEVKDTLVGVNARLTSGAFSFSAPPGATKAWVIAIGGGGTGSAGSSESFGGGGGGGGYAAKLITSTTIAGSVGAAGSATTVTGHQTASGGGSGSGSNGGPGGSASGGDINIPGIAGSPALAGSSGPGGAAFGSGRGGNGISGGSTANAGVHPGDGGGGGGGIYNGGAGAPGAVFVFWHK